MLSTEPLRGGTDALQRPSEPTDSGHPRTAAPTAWAAISPPPERTLLDVFAASVAAHPGRIALDAPDARLTYAELAEAARSLAARLNAAGIGAGDRVAIRVASGTSELYTAILGVLHASAAYVPIDADDPPTRAHEIRTRAAACAELRDGLVLELCAEPNGRSGLHGPSLDDDAWIIFTSGSTGVPKGVAVTHRSAAAFVDAETKLWTVDPEDRVLAGLSVAFDASCEEMWLAWGHGAALVPAPRDLVRAGAELGTWLSERGITVISTVPTLAALWDESCLSGVRLLILGGETCPEPLAWRLAGGREVWNTYGPTEATVVSTAARITPGAPVTIGTPLAGWAVAVLDDGDPVAPGAPGELVIAGVGLARYLDPRREAEGYCSVPALGWRRAYRTGDIVRATTDGLQFVGRRDDQVKIGGRRIELGEVEAVLSGLPGVRAAAVTVRESVTGNRLLVGYVVGAVDPAEVRAAAATRLPGGIVPLVAVVPELPTSRAGKVDRRALPWPLPGTGPGSGAELDGAEAWLAERWREQLGPVPIDPDTDFFAAGGTSLAAAKLVSALRERHPALAVADLYTHPTLHGLACRLAAIGGADVTAVREPERPSALSAVVAIVGVIAVLVLGLPSWLAGLLAVDRLFGFGPQLGWVWILGGWLVLSSTPARTVLVLVARRILLARLRPGRHPRQGWLAARIVFVERLAESARSESLAGTPFALRFARMFGHEIGDGARLGTLPPATSLVTIGPGATIEPEVDLRGWWIEGDELVIGAIAIGAGARIGNRALLMPGATVGAGAEIEPGSVITGTVPGGDRWAGSPARRVGRAGDTWPLEAPPAPSAARQRALKALYGIGLLLEMLLPVIAGVPELALWLWVVPHGGGATGLASSGLVLSPLLAGTFVVSLALVVAVAHRLALRLVRPGWHADGSLAGWALWLAGGLMTSAQGVLFPLYASSFTRRWLRLAGAPLEERVEVSTAVGLNHLTPMRAGSFAADDVVFSCARARDGWLHVAPIEVGERTFLGNGAILGGETRVGCENVVGLLTTPPALTPDGTCWLGAPAIELPRPLSRVDPARTLHPSRSLRAGRRAMDLVRILLPTTISVMLGLLLFDVLEAIGSAVGMVAMVAATAPLLLAAGVVACGVTAAVKWGLMGRYRPGDHPLFSFYVWRDEIVNTCQELLAGSWLMAAALGTPLVPWYLRTMGARVGRGVWIGALTITEFDLAELRDGAVVNRNAVVETHLFHDRVLSTGPACLGAGATLGPGSSMLPDTRVGDGCVVGGRSIVMRGEELPAGTRWHGAPVVVE